MSNETPSDHLEKQRGITFGQAIDIAKAEIARDAGSLELVIEEEKTIERPFGWVFFYTTKKYLDTGNEEYLMPGNSPLIVERYEGKVTVLSSSVLPEMAIEEYEKQWIERGNK
jgi:hypothetical protein